MSAVLLPEFDLFGYRERALEAKVRTKARQEKAERLEKAAKARGGVARWAACPTRTPAYSNG